MLYDKYRNWPLPRREGNVYSVRHSRQIGDQVLKDLAETEDEIDKKEILDSYAAYVERAYRQDVAESAAILAGQQLGSLLEPLFLSRLPEVTPLVRGRPVPEKKD